MIVSKINGEITILGLVVAKRKIDDFSSEQLNVDYEGMAISFEKGAILAYRNMPKLYVHKNYEELAGNESLFSIIKVGLPDDDIKPVSFDLNGDRIKILVDPKTFEAYIHYKQQTNIAMTMLVMPALVYMMDELRESGDHETYSKFYWFMRMKQYYHSQGKDFIGDIIEGEGNIAEIVQEMLKSPIGKAYRGLLENEV